MINFGLTIDELNLDRRDMLRLGISAGMLPMLAGNSAATPAGDVPDMSSSGSRLDTHVKLMGSTEEVTIYLLLEGTLWGVAPGRSPEAICGFRGLARSDWKPLSGNAFSQRSFDIGFFSDLKTGEPLQQVLNPVTGETVAPFHYKYGGEETIHNAASMEKTSDSSWGHSGNNLYFTERRGGTFPAPFSPSEWPRESSGETYFYGSETTYIAADSQFSNSALSRYDHTLFWSSFLSWEPWLLMEGAPGFVMWRGIGSKLADRQQVPKQLLAYIADTQPNYFDVGPPWEGRESTYRRYKETRSPAE